jgi:hypothetical protein
MRFFRILEDTGLPAAWEITRKEFYRKHHEYGRGMSLLQGRKRLEKLPRSEEIWVFHATDRKTADRFLSKGIHPVEKPGNSAMYSYEQGDSAEFAPGRGLGRGLYVGPSPQDVSGFGRVILAIKTNFRQLKVSPEAKELGDSTGRAALMGGGDTGALLVGKIPARNIIEVGTEGRYPKDAHRELVQAALKRGDSVPEEVLADYPDLISRKNEHVIDMSVTRALLGESFKQIAQQLLFET